MSEEEGSEKRTDLAYKRTELAYERTILAYFRAAASLTLFGVAFFGFREQSIIFIYGAYISVAAGIIFFLIAIARGWKHGKDIKEIAAQEVKKVMKTVLPEDE